jgi:hypothetical protein
MAPEAWAAIIGSTGAALSGVIMAFSGYRRSRAAQDREDLQECWREQERLRTKLHDTLHHTGRLEELLAMNRIKVPARPPSLVPEVTPVPPESWRQRDAATSSSAAA